MVDESDQLASEKDAAEAERNAAATREDFRSYVIDTFPDMSPVDVEATIDLLTDQVPAENANDNTPTVAIPAAVLLLVARCAMGSMSSVAVDELYSLIVHNKTASATDRIQSAVVGCLTGPGLSTAVKWVVRRFGTRIVAAALVVAIKLRRICIPRCL
jgi:hypothetical protein